MVDKKMKKVQEDFPFYKYLIDKILEEHTIGDIVLGISLGLVTTSIYWKMCSKK